MTEQITQTKQKPYVEKVVTDNSSEFIKAFKQDERICILRANKLADKPAQIIILNPAEALSLSEFLNENL